MSDDSPPAEERRQSLLGSLATKFATIYFGLWFVLVSGLPYQGALVDALARVLGIATPVPNIETGSGDRLYDWLSMGVFLFVALLGAALWAALDRRRTHDRTNVEIMRVFLRYGLGFMILGYGFGKTSQFPAPSGLELAKPLGEGTPMALMWNFMGASFAYSLFAGALEILGGLLLLFRRTTLLGAAVFAPVMFNVFVLNVCYDVPVKLYSFHALLGALVLLAPDARRLFDLFVLNRPVSPREIGPPVRYQKLRKGVLVVKWLALLGFVIVPNVQSFATGWQSRTAPQGPLAGAWDVSRFAGPGTPWTKAVVVEHSDVSMLILQMGDGKEWRAYVDDDKKGAIHLKGKDGTERNWRYRLSPPDALSVQEGETTADLRRDRREFPLMRHRLHWIQEQPRTP